MKCGRVECFAYSPVFNNSCAALRDTSRCNFYKTVEQIRREEAALREDGHPVYRPSITRQDRRILAALLRDERPDDMD